MQLLLLWFLMLLVALAKAKSFHSTARSTCEKEVCFRASSVVDETMNCVAKCISPKCFTKVYASAPLEDGEVDDKRRNQFSACVAQEERTERNWARRTNWNGTNNVTPEEASRRDSLWTSA